MTPFDFILLSLAAHRAWMIWLTQEIARPVREFFIRRGGWLGYFATCPFCTSVWAGGAAVALWLTPWGQLLIWALAVSSGISLLFLLGQRIERKDGKVEQEQSKPATRSPDEILRLHIGEFVIQLATLQAENEALKARVKPDGDPAPSEP